MGRTDFKSGEGRQTFLVGSTPTLFRHGIFCNEEGTNMSEPKVVEVFSDYV